MDSVTQYQHGKTPVFTVLARATLPGFNYTLLVLPIQGQDFYQLLRQPEEGDQSCAWITKESAMGILNDSRFEKTEYGVMALQNPEPAKEQWNLKTIFEEETI